MRGGMWYWIGFERLLYHISIIYVTKRILDMAWLGLMEVVNPRF